MKVYPSFRYQIARNRSTVMIYYLVWLILTAFVTVASLIFTQGEGAIVTTNGISAGSAICVFVLGLNAFKENFGMAVQNGVSRKSLFLGNLCTAGVLCAVMAVLDEAMTLLTDLSGLLPRVSNEASPLLTTAYNIEGLNPAVLALYSVAFSFFLLLACFGLGYFITILYYRLNTPGKVAVSVAVPCLFTFGVPILKGLRDAFHWEALWNSLTQAAARFFDLAFGAPWNCMVTCLVLFAVFHAFAWLLARKAALK